MKPSSAAYHSKSTKKTLKPKRPLSSLLTPQEVYQMSTRKTDWGIEGYEVPRKYYDYHQAVWQKRRKKILEQHKHVWPPDDWPKDKEDDTLKVKPKRSNYLDDLYKWCNSYYDAEKAERLIEDGIDVKEYKKKIEYDQRRRREFLNREKEKEEFKKNLQEIPEHKIEAIDAVKEKIQKHNEEKEITFVQKMKERYTKDRPQTSRCDRVTVVADAEYVGEQIPFYNTPENYTQDEYNKNKKMFFPDKTATWRRAPAWKYPKPIFTENENAKAKEEAHNEKVEEYLDSKGLTKKDLLIDVRKGFHMNTNHGRLITKFYPKTEYKTEEHYVAAEEDHPKKHVGPQHYWKMPKEVRNKRKYKAMLETLEDDDGNKLYYMDRRKTDKRVYIPYMRKGVY